MNVTSATALTILTSGNSLSKDTLDGNWETAGFTKRPTNLNGDAALKTVAAATRKKA